MSSEEEKERLEAEGLRDFLHIAGDIVPRPGGRAMRSEMHMRLQMRKDTVDMRHVGFMEHELYNLIWGDKMSQDKHALIDACARYGVAQALLDGIAPLEESLCVRNFNANFDFLSPFPLEILQPIVLGHGESAVQLKATDVSCLCPTEWRWPAWGFYDTANNDQVIYHRRRDERRAILVFYGFRNLGPELHVSNLEFWRGDVRLISTEDLSPLAAGYGTEYLMRTPCLYKAGDNFRIVVHTNADAIHQHDRIQPLGFVVEPLGLHGSG